MNHKYSFGLRLGSIDKIILDYHGVCRYCSALLAFDHVVVVAASAGYYIDPTDTMLHPLSLFDTHISPIGLDLRTEAIFHIEAEADQRLNVIVN
ncbi:MAG: hypothetical protein HC858_01620 [Brachymonas sp.]|nr:hypothetical protein [Brachymonas sp.]